MMTQKLHERQESDRQPCEILNHQSDLEFDALSFELKHSQDYQNSQSDYTEYEIDSIKEDFGEIFRVWDRRTLVGTFYETDRGWKGIPFYLCWRYIKAELDFSQDVEDGEKAIAYIKSMYEGRSQNSLPEQTSDLNLHHLIAA